MIGDVERNLQTLRPEQYVLAFTFLCSYALAIGRMLEPRGRPACAGMAIAAAGGFVACSAAWEGGVVVIALALVGMGAFSAAAWLLWTLASLHAPRVVHAAPHGGGGALELPDASTAPQRPLAAARLGAVTRTS